ncbi:MAG: hypothetical protein J0I84_14365 [Terrimonas sp.]|nr:hypothetical protein [Terrimonas sp.]OJY85328.1 MAG: hypothetical protein BGP13_22795 [Sphingobacteriales bacterium 40-81]
MNKLIAIRSRRNFLNQTIPGMDGLFITNRLQAQAKQPEITGRHLPEKKTYLLPIVALAEIIRLTC